MIQRKKMVKKLRLALCYYGETKNYFKFILNSMKRIQFSSSKCKLTVMEMICWPSTRATGTNCGILCRSRSSKSLIRLSNSLGNAGKTSVVNLQYVYTCYQTSRVLFLPLSLSLFICQETVPRCLRHDIPNATRCAIDIDVR